MFLDSLLRAQFHPLRTQLKQMNFLCSSRDDRKNFHMSGQAGFQAWDEKYWPSQVGVPWSLPSHSTDALKEFTGSGALVFLSRHWTLRWPLGSS